MTTDDVSTSATPDDESDGADGSGREDLPCGRLGRHRAHTWLTREDLWCAGTGVRGSSAPAASSASSETADS